MWWKRLDWYRKFMVVAIPVSLLLFFLLLGLDSNELIFSDWFINLISIPAFFGTIISGAGYMGRSFDLKKSTHSGLGEKIGTWIGLGFGLLAGFGLILAKHTIPFANTISVAADILFTVGTVSTYTGLCNRLGQWPDKHGRPKSDKRAMGIAAGVGFIAGILLFTLVATSSIAVVGATSVFTGGAAVPVWLCGIAFVGSLTSGCASVADYSSKAINFLRTKKARDSATMGHRYHEYRGAMVGVGTGLIVAGVIIGVLIFTQPYVLGAIAALLVIAACVSILGGLFSRIGRIIDASKNQKPVAQAVEQEEKTTENTRLIASYDRMKPKMASQPIMIVRPEPVLNSQKKPVNRDEYSVNTLLGSQRLGLINQISAQPKVASCPAFPEKTVLVKPSASVNALGASRLVACA